MEMELGISSVGAVHRNETIYPLIDGETEALVLQCSDPRFQDAFHSFVRQDLEIRKSAVIAVPGSTASFGVQAFLPKGWHALRKHIELMTRMNNFSRVVLINHDDCLGYAEVSRWLGKLSDLRLEQRKHLKVLAEFIRKEYLPKSRIELYQARIVEAGGGIKFEKAF